MQTRALGPAESIVTRDMLAMVLAAAFGVFLIFGAGFAHSDALHDAAHDTRHAMTFPCH